MYAMNDKKQQNSSKNKRANTAKECAYLAVFVALVIAAQAVLAFVPGVEVVTVLFIAYAFVFGWGRGMIAATAFSLLRQMLFGLTPNVLVLYLVYFNFLTAVFGLLGKAIKRPVLFLPIIILCGCVCTAGFTLFDDFLTPLWYAYSARATSAYFYASLPVMFSQILCTAITVGGLFLPLRSAFVFVKKSLNRSHRG